MRRSIIAPPGHVIVVRDLSQIEARCLCWLVGQEDVVEQFRNKEDVYSLMASVIFSKPVTKADKSLRFIGKVVVLGAGYGLGWRTFQERLRAGVLGDKGRILDGTVAQSLGVSVEIFLGNEYKRKFVQESLPLGSDFYTHATHCACCEAIISLFRSNKEKIPEFWEVCSEALARIYAEDLSWKFGKNGVLSTCLEGILLPNGMKIRYVELQQKAEKRRLEYSYLKERKTHFRVKTYGGSVTENVVQALSRIVLTNAMLRCKVEGVRIVHTVHDELLAVCREDEGSDVYRRMGEIMDKPPEWCADLPLASDGGWARRYQK
jgi:DNA polymerase